MYHNSTTYTSEQGIHIKMVNGEAHFSIGDLQAMICAEVGKLPKEGRALVSVAADARETMDILTKGLGHQLNDFKENSKKHLEDLRGLKFATVSEVSAMKKELADVRTFFVGAEHDREIAKLKEFVDLCERIAKLKSAGVLDAVADTMLKLA